MYDNFGQFFVDIRPYLPPDRPQYAHAVACWCLYQNARGTSLNMLVMGRLAQLGLTELANFGSTTEEEVGSILRSNNWSIVMNDSWILGGIHSQVEFQLASPQADSNIINLNYQAGQESSRILTITGRELQGLYRFGYSKVHESGDYGTILRCTKPDIARAATFREYRNHIEAISRGMIS